MKKAIFSLLIFILILLPGVVYANEKVSLILHPDVLLGVVDENIYQGATYEGGGYFQALTSDKKDVRVEWKEKKGEWRLRVKAVEVDVPVGGSESDVLSDFYWRKGEKEPWVKFTSLNSSQEVARSNKKKETYRIEYKYQPDVNDIPGNYRINLSYNVELYSESDGTWQPVTSDTVSISWQVKTWGIVKVKKTVNLGTIDASIYKNATPEGGGEFGYLESSKNEVFVICNDPDGWILKLLVVDVNYPPRFSSDLLEDFSWKVNGGSYQSGTNLDETAATVDVETRQGSKVYEIGYRYFADLNDIEGEYGIKLKYRLISANHQVKKRDTCQLLWSAQKWILLCGDKNIDLGVLDKSKVSIDSEGHLHFEPLRSLKNPLFVMSNSLEGWVIKLKVSSYSTPPNFEGDLLKDFKWRIRKGKYQSASGLDKKEKKIKEEKEGPLRKVYYIDYRYKPDIDDIQGEYKITLQYSVYPR